MGDPAIQIGHIHDDFRFPREVRDESIRTGRGYPSSRDSELQDDGELPYPERGRRGRNAGAVPHELRAKEATVRRKPDRVEW